MIAERLYGGVALQAELTREREEAERMLRLSAPIAESESES